MKILPIKPAYADTADAHAAVNQRAGRAWDCVCAACKGARADGYIIPKVRVVAFLQNAWSGAYAGGTWPRPSWLRALARCRSGQRLKLMIGDNFDWCDNITPIVGPFPESIVPADPQHIAAVIAERAPGMIVACGKHAEEALVESWPGPLLVVPHPAHRLLTDALYVKAKRFINPFFTERIALRQERGFIRKVPLNSAKEIA